MAAEQKSCARKASRAGDNLLILKIRPEAGGRAAEDDRHLQLIKKIANRWKASNRQAPKPQFPSPPAQPTEPTACSLASRRLGTHRSSA